MPEETKGIARVGEQGLRQQDGWLPAPRQKMMDMMEFAAQVCNAKFITAAARGDKASTFFLVAMADDLGLKWTHGLRSIYMTPDGKPGMQGDVMLALLYQHKFAVTIESTDKGATVKIKRPDGADPMPDGWSFTAEDAQRIKVWKKGEGSDRGGFVPLGEKYNYKSWGKSMYVWRALAPCARFVASDLLGGIYLNEELADLPPEGEEPPSSEPPMPNVGRIIKPKAEETKRQQPETKPPGETIEVKAEVAPEPEKKDPPKPEPGPQLVPKSDPTPAAVAEEKAAPKAKAAARTAQQEQVQRILDNMKELSMDAAKLRLQKFVRGFLGVTEVPKEYDKLKPALDMAEKLLAGGARKAFLEDPSSVGRVYGPGGESLRKLIADQDWSEATQELAIRVMTDMDVTPDGFRAYLASNKITDCYNDDANAFLQLSLVTRKMAYLVTDLGTDYNRPMAMLFNRILELVGDQKEWNTENVEAAITALTAELRGKPKDPPVAAPTVPTTTEVAQGEEPPAEQEGTLWQI